VRRSIYVENARLLWNPLDPSLSRALRRPRASRCKATCAPLPPPYPAPPPVRRFIFSSGGSSWRRSNRQHPQSKLRSFRSARILDPAIIDLDRSRLLREQRSNNDNANREEKRPMLGSRNRLIINRRRGSRDTADYAMRPEGTIKWECDIVQSPF